MYLGRCFAVCQLHLLLLLEENLSKVLNPQYCWVKKAKGLGKKYNKILIDTDSSMVMITGKGENDDGRILDFEW